MLWVCVLSKAETGQHWGNEQALKTDPSTSGPDSVSWEMLCILTDTSPNLMPQGRDTRAANGRSRSEGIPWASGVLKEGFFMGQTPVRDLAVWVLITNCTGHSHLQRRESLIPLN